MKISNWIFWLWLIVIVSIPLNLLGSEKMFPKPPKLTQIAGGLQFPEGPAWDGKKTLYVSNCRGNWITRISPAGVDTFLTATTEPFNFEKTNGMTVFKDGSLFACEFGRGAILRISPAGTSEIYVDSSAGQKLNRPNDLAFDAAGNLYFTDPNQYRRENPDGVVYRVAAGSREVTPVASNLAFPNGLAFSADGKFLFICESAFERVLRFKVRPDGTLAEKEIFVELPGGDPDGINFDTEGNLYVAHFGGGAVCIVAPDGQLRDKIELPGKKPTNVEFGGPDLRTLFITEVETSAVYQLEVPVSGLRLMY
jgi:gluconolactonase